MNAQEYRERNRKKVTCPSGLELEIRKIKALDYLRMGMLPDTLSEAKNAPEKIDPDMMEKIQKMFLTRAVVSQDNFKIVDKPSNEITGDEISYEDIEEGDINFLIKEISEFSFGVKDGENSATFREEPVSDAS